MERPRTILIHKLQQAAGWSLETLCSKADISQRLMSDVRRGEDASIQTLERLAKAFSAAKELKPHLPNFGFADGTVAAAQLRYYQIDPEPLDQLVGLLGGGTLPAAVINSFEAETDGSSAVEKVYSLYKKSPSDWDRLRRGLCKALKIKASDPTSELLRILEGAHAQIDDHGSGTDKAATPQESFGPEDAEKLRKAGTDMLYSAILAVLQSNVLRTFMLEKNGLASDLSAEQLTAKIVATTPMMLPSGEPSTAMSYLAKCRTPPLPDQANRRDILDGISDLIGLFAPLSFVFPDMSQFAALAKRAAKASHAMAPCTRPLIGASILALFLGKPVDIEATPLVKDNPNSNTTFMDSWGKLHTTDAAPILGTDEKDLINAIAIGLQPLVDAVDSSVTYVNASLQELHSQGTSVCIWFPRLMMDSDIELVKEAFPLVFPLVCSAKDDEQINAAVVAQIHYLLRFVKDNR